MRFAQQFADGSFQTDGDRVFMGLLEVMVMKEDRRKKGLGLQNFRYPDRYDEFAGRIAMLSPRVYKEFQRHFPGRTLRSQR